MMIRAAVSALALVALAGCATPPAEQAAAPAPAARFEPGGGEVREVSLVGQLEERLAGTWTGPYRPYDPARERVTGPIAGTARLEVTPRTESLAAANMVWTPIDGEPFEGSVVGALTLTGHIMLFNAHFIAYEQDGVTFIQADMLLPDGTFYRHRLTREEG
jgi:hypothetical protein